MKGSSLMRIGIKTYIKRYIEHHEGRKNYLYKCTQNKTTFGVGHNFDIKQDDELIDIIFEYDYKKLMKRLNMPKQFDFKFSKQPLNVRIVLTDMAFQMGLTGLKKFKRMLLAIEFKKYEIASKELVNSLYAKQTPARAKRNADLLIACKKIK